ncbi:MAG TPA: hypothetical protein PKU97_10420 [Kofleriaceae bacterium]|nr:hypothetical protein [Kofleriaceae bacterium]
MTPVEARDLTHAERAYVAAAKDLAFILYEGTRTPHRSCGIALAETFGLPTRAYQALRKGGISGEGACGAIRAGEQVLGELVGDPDPTGAVTPALREAILWYQRTYPARIDRGDAPDILCNTLVRRHGDFAGPARKAYCTNLAAEVAALTAEALLRFAPELAPTIRPLQGEPIPPPAAAPIAGPSAPG